MNPFTGGNHYAQDYDYSKFKNLLQRNISKKYGISLCKITRVSKILKKENSISKKLLLNIYKELKNGNS